MKKPISKPINKPHIGHQKEAPVLRATIYLLAVLAVSCYAFYPALTCGFTNWDDLSFVVENLSIRDFSLTNLMQMFVSLPEDIGVYAPLTFVSFTFDYYLAELDPFQYHLSNLILHLLNTAAVFLFVRLLLKKDVNALLTALLFGIAALHTESVVWVTERKNVLYTLFFFISLSCYVKFVDTRRNGYYLLTLLFFVVSLFSKGMAVSLPLVLIGIDVYRKIGYRNWRVIAGKVPFLALSLVFGILTIWAGEQTKSFTHDNPFAWYEPLFFASMGFSTYLAKLIIPFSQSSYYPYPDNVGLLPIEYYAYPLVVLIVVWVFFRTLKPQPLISFCIWFFTVNVVLVLQLFPAGPNIMAERYAYIPSVGLFMVLAYGLEKLFRHHSYKVVAMVVFGAYCCSMVYATRARAMVWENSESLWTDVMGKYPLVDVAYKNRGNYYARRVQRYDLAIEDYSSYIRIKPEDPSIYSNRGNVYGLMKEYDKAIADYSYTIKLDSKYTDAYVNRAVTYNLMGRYNLALADLDTLLTFAPNILSAYKNRGLVLLQLNQFKRAEDDFTVYLQNRPQDIEGYFNRAVARFNMKDYQGAVEDFSWVVKWNALYPNALYYRSMAYKNLGNRAQALADAVAAQQAGLPIQPAYVSALRQ